MAPVAKHRDGLIAAAAALFRKQGYAATGLAEILAESGAPKGSLYHYFPDGKEALGEAALRLAIEKATAGIGALIAATEDPGAMLRATFAVGARELAASGFRDGCALATISLEAAPQSARISGASREAFGLWSGAIAFNFARAGLPRARAAELADFVISSFEGALILARVRQDTTPILRAAEELARLVETELQTARSVQ